jgi:hypothetical protein
MSEYMTNAYRSRTAASTPTVRLAAACRCQRSDATPVDYAGHGSAYLQFNLELEVTMRPSAQAQDIRDACAVLEYLVEDLISAHGSYAIFSDVSRVATVLPDTEKTVRRMYVSYLVLALDKVVEFYSRYSWLLPDTCLPQCCDLRRRIEGRGIRRLRNTFIGHILDHESARPLTSDQVNRAFDTVTLGDVPSFLAWIHEPRTATNLHTVVGVLQLSHSELRRFA